MRCFLLVVALLLSVPASAPARREGGTLLALVADAGSGRLLAIHVGGGARDEVRIADGPASLAATAVPHLAVVVSARARRVTIVDVRSMRAAGVVRGFGAPCDVALGPGARYAYVTDERRGRLAVLDVRARRVVARVAFRRPAVPARRGGPHDLDCRRDRRPPADRARRSRPQAASAGRPRRRRRLGQSARLRAASVARRGERRPPALPLDHLVEGGSQTRRPRANVDRDLVERRSPFDHTRAH